MVVIAATHSHSYMTWWFGGGVIPSIKQTVRDRLYTHVCRCQIRQELFQRAYGTYAVFHHAEAPEEIGRMPTMIQVSDMKGTAV